MRTAVLLAISVLAASTASAQMRERSGMALEQADANHDGVVTRDEFMNASDEQF